MQTETANSAADLQTESKAERGEKTAENIRYGQGISEQGTGGQTTTSTGKANTEGKSFVVACFFCYCGLRGRMWLISNYWVAVRAM